MNPRALVLSLSPFFWPGLFGAALRPEADTSVREPPSSLPRSPPDTPFRLGQSVSP
jgi:hypothetical protein